MTYPIIYDVTYSYTGFQLSQGDDSFPGTQLDADLAGLENSIEDVATFVRGVMRSDGALNNGIVTYDSLAPALQLAGLAPAVAWTTATNFPFGSAVAMNSNLYRCVIQHTSGVFATDLLAGKWVFVAAVQFGPPSDFETRTLAAATTIAAPFQYVRTAGYAAAGDGGGALYKRVVSLPTDTNGFQSADGAWWQYAEIVFNVLAFGADPTGATSSQTAVNNAIRHAALVHGEVFFPPGLYIVNGGVNLTNRQLLTLRGSGLATTVLQVTTPTNAVLDMTGCSAVTVRDLQITCAHTPGMANFGILLAESSTLSNNICNFYGVSVTGYFTINAVCIYGSTNGIMQSCQISEYNPSAQPMLFITSTNLFGASSSFTTIGSGVKQSGDWVFDEHEIHDLSQISGVGASTVVPVYIYGEFAPLQFIGGVIAGSRSAGEGMVSFGSPSGAVTGISFVGTHFYADNGTPVDVAFYAHCNVTGLSVTGSNITATLGMFASDSGITWKSLNIAGNSTFPGAKIFAASGNVTVTRSIIDAQGLPLDLGAGGALSHSVILNPGTITGVQTSNGIF